MANDISITIRGFVGKDPKLTEFSDGGQVTTFRVGCTPRYRDRSGNWHNGETQWFSVRARGALAVNSKASLRGGHPVLVHGRLIEQRWEQDGTDRVAATVIAESVAIDLSYGVATYSKAIRSKRDNPTPGQSENNSHDGAPAPDHAATAGGSGNVGSGVDGREVNPYPSEDEYDSESANVHVA